MTIELEYSSVLTGAGFMLYEVKQIALLKEQGFSDTEIKQKVLEENVFQYEKMSSIKRAFPYILKRVNVLDEILLQLIMKESLETAKIINLYAIMKSDRLFFEFMHEVIQEKLQKNDYLLEKKDVNSYFTAKAEQSDFIASWSETTIQKLKQVYKKILLETGMLKSLKTGELNRLIIDEQIKCHLKLIDDERCVRAMGE
ncbi:DUF1819 family protein [Psychrobacillus sp. PGGUH221]|uniref:DUF1819 family protein n=1 Tax=Psychrobacillus sp. PGGUH221 TaxID=3020058 RepID=UPI0035C73C04